MYKQSYVIVKMHNNFSNHCFVNQEHEQKCKIVILKFEILVHIVQHGEAPCINGDTHCTMTLTFLFLTYPFADPISFLLAIFFM